MNTFCVFNSTRSLNSGFAIKFFQNSSQVPLQIVRDKTDNLILPVEFNKKLSIQIRNRSYHYRGIVVTLGGYNLSQAGSIKASSTYDEGIYEVNPKQTILINKKYKNMLTRDGERDLMITEDDLGSYLCIYFKGGTPQYYGNHEECDLPDLIKYTRKAHHILSIKLVAIQQIPNNGCGELIAA